MSFPEPMSIGGRAPLGQSATDRASRRATVVSQLPELFKLRSVFLQYVLWGVFENTPNRVLLVMIGGIRLLYVYVTKSYYPILQNLKQYYQNFCYEPNHYLRL